MDSYVSPKDEIWFLRVCHHISNAVCTYRNTYALSVKKPEKNIWNYSHALAVRVHADWVIQHHRCWCHLIEVCCCTHSVENLNPCGSGHEVAVVPCRLMGSTPHWQALDAAQINVTPVWAESFDIMGWVELYCEIIAS